MKALRLTCAGLLLAGCLNARASTTDAGDVVDVGDTVNPRKEKPPSRLTSQGLKNTDTPARAQATTPRVLAEMNAEKKVPVFFAGSIAAISISNLTVVVNGCEVEQKDVLKRVGKADEERTFKANALCRIKTANTSHGTIKDLKPGDAVAIRFDASLRGGFKADSIEPLDVISKRQADEKKAQAERDKKKKKK